MTHPATAFILMIGDDAALLLPPVGKEKAAPLLVSGHEDKASILAALSQRPRAPVIVLADVLAQDYKREPLPPLISFFDRRKVLARRLSQAFPKTDLKASLTTTDENALFVGIDQQSPVTGWLDALSPLRNASGGVSLLPLESAGMLSKLTPVSTTGWGLLLLAHKTGGFRQIVTKNGVFLFTRLTPPLPSVASPDTVCDSLAQDIQATRAYLARSGLTDDMPLHLAAILPPALHQSFTALPLPVATRLLFSPREAAARLNLTLPPQPDEPSCDLVSILWFQSSLKPLTNLMRPKERAEKITQLFHQAGLTLAAFMTALALTVSAIEALSVWQSRSETLRMRDEVAAIETEYEKAQHTLAREAEPLARLRKAVERRRLFSLTKDSPEILINLLDAALEPEAIVLGMEWKTDTLTLDLKLKDERFTGNLDAVTRQEVTRRFDDLLTLMRETLKGYVVTITRYPFPHLSNETITNRNPEIKPPPPTASFLIRKEGAP